MLMPFVVYIAEYSISAEMTRERRRQVPIIEREPITA